jgi:hypothetical protein
MRIETKELDYFKREHMVSYNFTVRTHGFNCWKVSVEIRCKDEILNLDYQLSEITISWLMEIRDKNNKSYFMWNNLPIEIKEAVFNWLCDFPRYVIREALTMEKLCTARTYADAQDEQSNFTFETLIEDTWKL